MSLKINFNIVDNSMGTMDKMSQYIVAGMDTAIDVVSDYQDYQINDYASLDDTLETTMNEYCAMEYDMKKFVQSIQYIKRQIQAEGCEEDTDLVQMVEDHMKELGESEDVNQHPKKQQLLSKIKQVKAKESSNEMSLEYDFEVSQAVVATKCPFTGKEMVDPLKNIHCGHRYDREGIKQLLNQRGKKARCPVSGCANSKNIVEKDLVEDKELKKLVKAKNKKSK